MNYYKLLSNLEVPAALLPILKTYYYNIAFVSSESQFNNLMETLAEIIWQGVDQYTVAEIKGIYGTPPMITTTSLHFLKQFICHRLIPSPWKNVMKLKIN